MKRLLFIAFAALLMMLAACGKNTKMRTCNSHTNNQIQNSVVEIIKSMHIDGVALVIDDSSNVVAYVGVKDSTTLSVPEINRYFSRILNPGNFFKPMLLALFLDDDSVCNELSDRQYSCCPVILDTNKVVADHRIYGIVNDKMSVKEALEYGSNVAWYDFIKCAYPDEQSRVRLAVKSDRLLPQEVPFHKCGFIYQNEWEFMRFSIGYGISIMPYSLAFYYHALAHRGLFRLVNDDCTYRYQRVCSEHTATKVLNILQNETGNMGIHGTMTDSTASYPSYIGYTSDLKYTVVVMLLENHGNTAVARRVFDAITDNLKN